MARCVEIPPEFNKINDSGGGTGPKNSLKRRSIRHFVDNSLTMVLQPGPENTTICV
jgi:hypothetical protein